jgi:hypothetical protein
VRALRTVIVALTCLPAVLCATQAGHAEDKMLPHNARVYIAAMPDGFDGFLKTAIAKKQVPLTVVEDRSQAAFEMTGHSETQKAGAAKKAIMLNWHSNEEASIKVANLETGEIVFAYSVSKKSSAHGKKSTAEACAKHLKENIAASR